MCNDWAMDSMAGSLVVATPLLVDPHFFRTVVLILQHDEDGCLGVVLNRPTTESVSAHIPEWAAVVPEPGLVHYGGPVDPAVAIGLALGRGGEEAGVPGLSLVDLSEEPTGSEGPVKIYSGYAGWGAGQLEAELAEGSWYRVQASPDDPFDNEEGQWRRVLRRQPGFLSVVSTYTDDPDLN